MDTTKMLDDLKKEHNRIGKMIAILEEGDDSIQAQEVTHTPKRKVMTNAERKRRSDAMKKRWAERKKKEKASS